MKAQYEPKSILYKNSPLASLIGKTLNEIKRLKANYPENKTDSPELVYARKQIIAIEELLKLVETKLIPIIDKQALLSLFNITVNALTFNDIHNSIEKLMALFETRKSLVLSALKEVLPTILKDTLEKQKEKPETDFNTHLMESLKQQKQTILKKAAEIPDEKQPLELLFTTVKSVLVGLHLDNYDKSTLCNENTVATIAWRLDNKLSDSDEKTAASTLFHPMSLELALFLANVMQDLPATLNELVPFLNPKSVCEIFNSTVVQLPLKLFTGLSSTLLEHSPLESNLSFTYKLALTRLVKAKNEKGKEVEKPETNKFYIDASKYYAGQSGLSAIVTKKLNAEIGPTQLVDNSGNIIEKLGEKKNITLEIDEEVKPIPGINYRSKIEATILSAASGCMTYCENSPKAQEELAKANLLQNFVIFESSDICQKVAALDKKVSIIDKNINSIPESNPRQTIQSIDKELEYLNLQLASHKTLTLELESTQKAYATKPFKVLLDSHAMGERLKEDSQKNFDTTYANSPLPDKIIGRPVNNGKVAKLAIKSELDTVIKRETETLSKIESILTSHENYLHLKRRQAVTAWKAELDSSFIKELREREKKLEVSVNASPIANPSSTSGKSIKTTAKKKARGQSPMEQMTAQIKVLEGKIEGLEIFKQELTSWSQSYLSEMLSQPEIAQDEALLQEFTALSKALAFEIKQSVKQITNTQYLIQHQLNEAIKNKENAIRAEMVKEANPEKLKKSVEQVNSNLEALKDQHKDLEAQYEEAIGNVSDKRYQLHELSLEKLTKEAEKQTLLDTNTQLISEAVQLIEQHRYSRGSKSFPQEFCFPSLIIENFVQWIDQEKAYIAEVMEENSLKCAKELQPYQNNLSLFKKIKNILQTQKETIIPFEDLDKEVSSSNGSKETNPFLILVGQTDSLKYWDGFRKQNNLLFNPGHKDWLAATNQLLAAIEQKRQAEQEGHELCFNSYNQNQSTLEQLNLKLMEIKNSVISNKDSITTLETELTLIPTKEEALKQALASLEQDKSDSLKAVEKSRLEQQDCTKTIAILEASISVIKAIVAHQELIYALSAGQDIEPIILSRKQLDEKNKCLTSLLDKAATLPNIDNYRDMEKNNQKLIEDSDKRFYETVCLEPITSIQEGYNALNNKFLALVENQDMDSGARKKECEALSSEHKQLLDSLNQHVANLLNVDLTLFTKQPDAKSLHSSLNNKLSELASTIQAYSDNQDAFYAIYRDLVRMRVETSELGDRALLFDAMKSLKNPESISQLLDNERELGYITNKLSDYPNQEKLLESLTTIQDASNRNILKDIIGQIERNKGKIETNLNTSRALCDLQDKRILARNSLYRTFKQKLKLCPNVGNTDLKQTILKKLEKYNQSGNSAELFKFLLNHRNQFPEQYQLILNQLTAAVIDSDRKIPTDYTMLEPVQVNYADEARTIVEALNNDLDKEKIKSLYQQVDKMRQFANTLEETDPCRHTANTLAAQLDEDIHRFVVKHNGHMPQADTHDFALFKDHFSARAHSKDDDMGEHLPTWLIVIANITYGVFSLGIATGIKLWHSHKTTGQFSFFHQKTDLEEKVGEVNHFVGKILAPVA